MANKIFPCLWYNNQAKEAAEFYCSIFPNSKIISINPMVVICELNGQRIMGLNGGPMFPQTEAISLVIECKDQEEIDHYSYRLIADGGNESQCGWCKDKFGVSWQVVPDCMGALMSSPEKAQRVTAAYMKMKKMDIEVLKNA